MCHIVLGPGDVEMNATGRICLSRANCCQRKEALLCKYYHSNSLIFNVINTLNRRKITEYLQMSTNLWVRLMKTYASSNLTYAPPHYTDEYSFALRLWLPYFWFFLLLRSGLFALSSSVIPLLCQCCTFPSVIIVICWMHAQMNEWMNTLCHKHTSLDHRGSLSVRMKMWLLLLSFSQPREEKNMTKIIQYWLNTQRRDRTSVLRGGA